MPDVRIRIEGSAELSQALSDPEFIRGPLRGFLRRAAFIVEDHMKELAPVDTGRLRSSIVSNVQTLRAQVAPHVEYAPYVEYGTRPHMPPPGALQPWAMRHGFPAGAAGDWMVRRAIARRGTRAHPFVRPAARKSMPDIARAIEQLVADIRLRVTRHAV